MNRPPEPKVRKDGLCFLCQKERPPIAVLVGDPFCSANCCRKHYLLEPLSDSDRPAKPARKVKR